jgi:hypothetical protein
MTKRAPSHRKTIGDVEFRTRSCPVGMMRLCVLPNMAEQRDKRVGSGVGMVVVVSGLVPARVTGDGAVTRCNAG